MGALRLYLGDQLCQPAVQLETGNQPDAVVTRLHGPVRPTGLGLFEAHTSQHRLAIANHRFDGTVVGFQQQCFAALGATPRKCRSNS